jgi:hypothetical protein
METTEFRIVEKLNIEDRIEKLELIMIEIDRDLAVLKQTLYSTCNALSNAVEIIQRKNQ